jgi:transposase InsO family protein
MQITMEQSDKLSLEEIRAFLEATKEVQFRAPDRGQRYGWIDRVLRHHRYRELDRAGKGLVRLYAERVTGLSRAQVARIVGLHLRGEPVKPAPYRRHRFAARYTRRDIELLAEVDQAHETLSGPATQKLLHRAFHDFHDPRYRALASISVAQLYRLRATAAYRKQHTVYQPTRPTPAAIGERRKPQPNGRPGFLRVDTVHQGDQDGIKGLYHINAVDEVTQWEVVASTPHISEAWLLPVLEDMLDQFPFHIRGFHTDNGSEFINKNVSGLLNKLLIEQTKSRPRHSNDNGLAETKNGSVVRKHIGWGHIACHHAEAFQQFHRQHFNPYLNFHRPCAVPELRTTQKGRTERVYRWYLSADLSAGAGRRRTPWEILRQLPDLASHLKPGITIDELNRQATQFSDTEAASRMRNAKIAMLTSIRNQNG